ncbi:MAG: putative histidine kinase, classic [Verrucomicrobiales bacterium]|nr:putative histidine kinase, classic [Verrucomicrobiales bacterium]
MTQRPSVSITTKSSAAKLVWLPVPLLLLAILVLWQTGSSHSYESAAVLLGLNLVFTSLVSFFIVILAGWSFLKHGQGGLAMMGCAMLMWGGSAFAATVGGHTGNYNITIHNTGVLGSALLHLGGVLWSLLGATAVRSRHRSLLAAYLTAACTVGLIWLLTARGWLPFFFIQGEGGTPFRRLVLLISMAAFATAAALLWSRHLQTPSPFLQWYSIGLGLVAIGALGLLLQMVHGSVLGWTARAAQYLGGVYILIGALTAIKQAGAWELLLPGRSLEEVSFRQILRRATIWPALVLLALVLLLLGLVDYLLESARRVDHSQEVLAQISQVEKLTVDMETGIRGYRLTGERAFLQPFEHGEAALPAQLSRLQNLVRDDSDQLRTLKALRDAHRVWSEFATNVRNRVELKLPTDVALHLRGKDLMDALRARIDGMQAHEQIRLAGRSRALARLREISFAGILLGAFLVAPLLMAYLRHSLERLNATYGSALATVEMERERLREVLESITDGFHVVDASGRFTYFNGAAKRMFVEQGVDATALIGQPVSGMFAATPETGHILALQRTLSDRVPTEAENLYAPWQRWYATRNYPTPEGGVATFFQDITERKRVEVELARNAAILRAITENSSDLVYVKDQAGRMLYANPTACRVIGKPYQEVLGKNEIEWGGDTSETRTIMENDRKLMACKGAETVEEIFTGADGITRVYHSSKACWCDQVGNVLGVVSIARDITKRKEAEAALARATAELQGLNQSLEATVEQRTIELRNALSELEGYSYSVAHDMRAPLRAMNGFAKLLESDYGPQLDDTARNYLHRISSSSDRMDRLIQDVLNYSKIVSGELTLEKVPLQALLRDIIETYPNLQAPKVQIMIEDPLPAVVGNLAALTQVFSNLLGNAAKFVAPGVVPEIKIRAENQGPFVRVWVEDNGIGMERIDQKRIFQLFGRIERPELYEGTGLGLSIVRKATEKMGGKVGVESERGKGSRFWVELPLPI